MTVRLGGEEYLLRRDGADLRIGSHRGGEVRWLDPVDAGSLPEGARTALDRGNGSDETLLTAVRGIVQAEIERGA